MVKEWSSINDSVKILLSDFTQKLRYHQLSRTEATSDLCLEKLRETQLESGRRHEKLIEKVW